MPDGFSGFVKQVVESGIGYVWFLILAIWGGTVSHLSRIKKTGTPFSLIELFGEWTISGFSGLITAYICMEMNFSFFMTAALTGIAGHMGGRAIYMIEKVLHDRFIKNFSVDDDTKKS